MPSEIELNLEILIISFVIECCGLAEIQEKRYRERETSVARRRLATKNWLKFKPLFPSFVRGYTEEIACIRVKLNCYNVTIIDCSNSTKRKVEILARSEDSFRDEMITGNRKIQHGLKRSWWIFELILRIKKTRHNLNRNLNTRDWSIIPWYYF